MPPGRCPVALRGIGGRLLGPPNAGCGGDLFGLAGASLPVPKWLCAASVRCPYLCLLTATLSSSAVKAQQQYPPAFPTCLLCSVEEGAVEMEVQAWSRMTELQGNTLEA